SMLSSSALVSHEFCNRLDDLITMSNIVRADVTVQNVLDEIRDTESNYRTQYYSEIYSALQQHYLEYKHNYIKFAAISCPRFVSYTYGYTKDQLDAEKLTDLVKTAEEGEGSAIWVTDYARTDGLYLVREIKKIQNLSLDNLGTFIVKIEFDKLVEEVSKVSKEYEGCYWILYDKNNMIYASDELTDAQLLQINEEIDDYGVITIKGEKYFAIRGNMEMNDWGYFHLVSYDEVADSQTVTLQLYMLILTIGLLFSSYMIHIVVRKLMRHINLLVERMKEFGDNSEYLPVSAYDYSTRMDEAGMLHRQFDRMAEQIKTLVVENYRQQLLMKDAQLKSLEAQMNPHFLYNTLDTINWRAKAIGEKEISQIAESLGHFLRMTLSKKSDNFTLREEITIIQYYMTIQQLRFDNRLNFNMNIPMMYQDAMVPKLSIQPLLENAVHYALEQITEDCDIWLTCTGIDNVLQIYVKNSGSEFEENLLEKLRSHEIKEKGLGIALLNIEERIQLM
ncbi:MAG: histidine kinase, partial [Lachnospiraceae bacterium]|nr:histidine kinase [Lachnospiraceae bacterium]